MDKPNKVDVSRKLPYGEKQTVKDYILRVASLEGESFRHQANGKVYTIKSVEGDLKTRWIVTEKGKKIPLENCLRDMEVNLGELIKIPENERC